MASMSHKYKVRLTSLRVGQDCFIYFVRAPNLQVKTCTERRAVHFLNTYIRLQTIHETWTSIRKQYVCVFCYLESMSRNRTQNKMTDFLVLR